MPPFLWFGKPEHPAPEPAAPAPEPAAPAVAPAAPQLREEQAVSPLSLTTDKTAYTEGQTLTATVVYATTLTLTATGKDGNGQVVTANTTVTTGLTDVALTDNEGHVYTLVSDVGGVQTYTAVV